MLLFCLLHFLLTVLYCAYSFLQPIISRGFIEVIASGIEGITNSQWTYFLFNMKVYLYVFWGQFLIGLKAILIITYIFCEDSKRIFCNGEHVFVGNGFELMMLLFFCCKCLATCGAEVPLVAQAVLSTYRPPPPSRKLRWITTYCIPNTKCRDL